MSDATRGHHVRVIYRCRSCGSTLRDSIYKGYLPPFRSGIELLEAMAGIRDEVGPPACGERPIPLIAHHCGGKVAGLADFAGIELTEATD